MVELFGLESSVDKNGKTSSLSIIVVTITVLIVACVFYTSVNHYLINGVKFEDKTEINKQISN